MFSVLWASFYISARSKFISKTVKYLLSTYYVSSMTLDAGDTYKKKDGRDLRSLSLASHGER